MDRDLHTILGTVYRAAQQIEKSRDVIQSFFAEYPSDTNTPSHHNSARILCTLGADRTVYLFEEKEDGSTKKIRRGGHFTLKFLLDKDNYHWSV